MSVDEFRTRLVKLWTDAHDVQFRDKDTTEVEFPAWSGATKDLLLGLGMEWDSEAQDYVFGPVGVSARGECSHSGFCELHRCTHGIARNPDGTRNDP